MNARIFLLRAGLHGGPGGGVGGGAAAVPIGNSGLLDAVQVGVASQEQCAIGHGRRGLKSAL